MEAETVPIPAIVLEERGETERGKKKAKARPQKVKLLSKERMQNVIRTQKINIVKDKFKTRLRFQARSTFVKEETFILVFSDFFQIQNSGSKCQGAQKTTF